MLEVTMGKWIPGIPALQQGWRHASHQVVEELSVEKAVEQELGGCTGALYTFPIFQKFLIWLLLLPSRCVIGFFVVRETLQWAVTSCGVLRLCCP